MGKIIIQVLMAIALPLLILIGFFKGMKGKKQGEIYSPADDAFRGTSHRHDEVNPPIDTRQLIENEQVEQYEQTQQETITEIELENK